MISEIIEKWIKGILIDGITGNLSGLFDNVNAKVGEIASDVGSTPQAWNSGIFNMLRSLSETVVLPIAAAILALVMCHELIQMITEKNNMHDFDTSIDTSAFEQGKVVLLSKTVEDLIQPGQEITIQTQNGQHSFIVANGYLNEGFRAGGGNERGTAPDLYISQTALKELFPQYRVFRVAFDTDGQHDESILQELKQITASQANIDIISRYERREEMQEYLITAKVLGTGLSVILLLVGVMNFVNTMVVNVNTRRYELAVLESIGMTKRQIKRMLFMEGFYYWGVSLSLAVTIGTAIFILLYMIFSKVAYYAVFSYPFIPLVLVSGLVLLICLIVPIWVYKTDVNLPVVERLRLTE